MKKSASTNRSLPVTSTKSGEVTKLTEDVYCYTNQIVNAYFVRDKTSPNEWVLVDAGMPASGVKLLHAAESVLGKDHSLKGILLTHGHFDHVGGIVTVLKRYPVPVYAHPLEFPYLKGEQDYPKPDNTVEGGLLAKMASLYPVEAIDISEHLQALPEDGSVPMLPGWKWIHTPGHSPGHVCFFRDEDRLLIAGDAFVTVEQDSLYQVVTQIQAVHGPPVYLTTDWKAAEASVQKIEALKPAIGATGHGQPMAGQSLLQGLNQLATNFKEVAVPEYGRYVEDDK